MNFYRFLIFFFGLGCFIFAFNDRGEKNIYFFGDSVTEGYQCTKPYTEIVAKNLGMRIVYNLVPYGFQGTTMMNQHPYNLLNPNGKNMEYWAKAPNTPLYDAERDGFIFIAYLINDVGMNVPNYSAENFSIAVDNVIAGLFKAGWPRNRIKFNIRYYITEAGLDFTNINDAIKKPATYDRYNKFAQILKDKLDQKGIQYFDFWDELSSLENPDSYLDIEQRHPNDAAHNIIANYILERLKM